MKPEPRPFWSLSFHYDDWERAGTVYEKCRDLIFSLDVDASAYRILLNQKAHVVVVGIGLPNRSLIEQISEFCHEGQDAPLPEPVVITLALRHEQFAVQPGTKFERRAQL
jgi:hypothetical protein